MSRHEFSKRSTDIYFPTEKDMEHWKKIANEKRISLSKLLLAGLVLVEEKEKSTPSTDLLKENQSLKEDLAKVKRELKLQEGLIEKYESELYRSRYAGFQDVSPEGENGRNYDLDLIAFLKNQSRPVDSGKILAHLQIAPSDHQAVRLVRNQLESLEKYGLVSQDSHGWRWKK